MTPKQSTSGIIVVVVRFIQLSVVKLILIATCQLVFIQCILMSPISKDRMCSVHTMHTSLPTVCNGISYSIKLRSPGLLLKRWWYRWIAYAVKIITTTSSIAIILRQIPSTTLYITKTLASDAAKKKMCLVILLWHFNV